MTYVRTDVHKTGRSALIAQHSIALLLALCISAEAQQPKKIVQIGYLSPQSEPPRYWRHSKRGYANSAGSRGNRSTLSIAMPGASLISFLSLRLNLFASKLTSLSRGLVMGHYCSEACDDNDSYCDGGGYRPSQ